MKPELLLDFADMFDKGLSGHTMTAGNAFILYYVATHTDSLSLDEARDLLNMYNIRKDNEA